MYVTGMAYRLRDEQGAVEVVHDRHWMGLFPQSVWLDRIVSAGFQPLVVAFDHASSSGTGRRVFLGLRPAGAAL